MMKKIIEVKKVEKVFNTKSDASAVRALNGVDFTLNEGEFISIMGESGSGKSTLLNILATLDKPTSGVVLLDGKDLTGIHDNQLADFRRDNLGFVFQDFNLLDTLSIKENIYLPLVLSKQPHRMMKERIAPLAKQLGIEELLEKYPFELSGGQKQRAAVCRALMTNPRLILADEPTGALDSRNATMLLEMFKKINEQGQTIIMVTHSFMGASYSDRVLFIKDGKIHTELSKDGASRDVFRAKINEIMSDVITGNGEV